MLPVCDCQPYTHCPCVPYANKLSDLGSLAEPKRRAGRWAAAGKAEEEKRQQMTFNKKQHPCSWEVAVGGSVASSQCAGAGWRPESSVTRSSERRAAARTASGAAAAAGAAAASSVSAMMTSRLCTWFHCLDLLFGAFLTSDVVPAASLRSSC